MSDTPRTDAKSFIAFDPEGRKLTVVLSVSAEQLERELAAVTAERDALARKYQTAREYIAELERVGKE